MSLFFPVWKGVALTALLRGGGWGEGGGVFPCLGGEAGPLLQLFPGPPRLGVKGSTTVVILQLGNAQRSKVTCPREQAREEALPPSPFTELSPLPSSLSHLGQVCLSLPS